MELKEYFSTHGNQSKLSKETGIAIAFLSQMASKKRPVPAKLCLLIERKTNKQVTRKDLLPSDWQMIWPNLK